MAGLLKLHNLTKVNKLLTEDCAIVMVLDFIFWYVILIQVIFQMFLPLNPMPIVIRRGHRKWGLGPSIDDHPYLEPQLSSQIILHVLHHLSISFSLTLSSFHCLRCKSHIEREKTSSVSVLNCLREPQAQYSLSKLPSLYSSWGTQSGR